MISYKIQQLIFTLSIHTKIPIEIIFDDAPQSLFNNIKHYFNYSILKKQDYYIHFLSQHYQKMLNQKEAIKFSCKNKQNYIFIPIYLDTHYVFCIIIGPYSSKNSREANVVFSEIQKYLDLYHEKSLQKKTEIIKSIRFILSSKDIYKYTLSQWSKKTGYSENHLSKSLSKFTEKGFNELKEELRINHAKKLLILTKLPITKIALELGYYDTSHFSNHFKKRCGLSPRQFRNKKLTRQ
ncbi:MAG: helix-turn-helix transcriptional regulator [Streptococcaceae bacterium]|jgi:AraC-like DNA-binding protein|nr:helix-turn-helix transcriptional regulator [Streptococcaceae bacterium]